jgi:hypothetical protein
MANTPEQTQYDADLAALNALSGVPRVKAKEALDAKYPKGRPGNAAPVEPVDPNNPPVDPNATDAEALAALGGANNYGIGEALLDEKVSIYATELKAVFALYKAKKNTEALDLLNKTKFAKLDTDARNRYIQKVQNSDVYKEKLNSWIVGIKKELADKNITVSDEKLADYYLRGIDNAVIVDEAIGGLTAKGGDTASLTNLRITAEANGLNLDKDFADKQDSWLQAIARGQDANKFYALIREKAGEGKSEYVKKQLLAGKDLRSIYGTFLGEMAAAFDIPAESIDLNDPLLAKAFTDKGTIKLGDFKTLLQSDSRYKGTAGAITNDNIKESTLSYLNKVAKENGIDLTAKYGRQIDGWVNDVIKGKSLDSVAQIIRNDLATDKSKYIKEQLALGKNLNEIYGTYIRQMATVFGVPEDTIDINDPLLAKAFTDKGPLNSVQFGNLLRVDSRYKGTTSAIGESQIVQSVKDAAIQIGADLTDQEITDIANEASSKGLSVSSPEITALIRGKVKYVVGGKLKGQAGTVLDDLKKTAAANGLDFDTQFGTQGQEWIAKILQGEDANTFKKIIRQIAKTGYQNVPQVSSLLDQGIDLETIYAPYKNVMASILEINPQTITLNDKTLRSAIGEKEMTLYDWERLLRKDARWQYTDKARQEVSGIGLNVLQQLGFQG